MAGNLILKLKKQYKRIPKLLDEILSDWQKGTLAERLRR